MNFITSLVKSCISQVTGRDEYKHWQDSLTKEKYEFYKNCVRNYAQDLDLEKFMCPIM